MSKIRLQELTPDIYYNQSRDFQFIGRLFDVVLNYSKLNADSLYNLPLNEYTDEKLIDLMTMTLGFKSRHNYNVKQLTSLCSAFSTILRNKGNISSIVLAVQALLNAEGIKDDVYYEIDSEYTTLFLHIPETLSDINLVRDLLNYVLPAGMSCNIIRDIIKEDKTATTVLKTADSVNSYVGINLNEKSMIIQAEASGIADATAKDTAGLIANSELYREEITYGKNKKKKQ